MELPLWLQVLGWIFVGVEWFLDVVWPSIENAWTLFLGIVLEAFPFIVLGVVISTLVALFIKDEWIQKYLPKNRFFSHALLGLLGIIFPVCQCGNVPVARRLMAKGFTPSQAITFMLAAPIVNPITLVATLQAFTVAPGLGYLRIGLGYVIALGIGLLISVRKNQRTLLEERFISEVCEVDHDERGVPGALSIFGREFMQVFSMLLFGAGIAAIVQAFVPLSFMTFLGDHIVYSVLAMMVLGFVLALCSTVDAFFALSYSQSFTLGSLMAFMLIGPTMDIKIISMLRGTFTTRTLVYLTLAVAACAFVAGVGINIWYKPFL